MISISPNKKAVDFIRAKAAINPDDFGRLPEELRIRAFTTAAAEDLHTLRRILDTLEDLPAGADWNAKRREVAALIGGGPDATAEERKAGRNRARLIVQTAGRQAYAVGRHAEMTSQSDVFPYWRYVADGDSSTRPTHKALDGKVLRADDPFWDTHFPPWDYGCRCTVVPLTEEEAQQGKVYKGEDLPGAEPDAYRFNPRDLNRDPDDLAESYGAEWPLFVETMRTMNAEVPKGNASGHGTATAWDFFWRGYERKDAAEMIGHAQRTRTEMAVVRDWDTGAVIERKTGDADSVQGMRALYDRALSEGKTVRGTHVHPPGSGYFPSPDDVLMALHPASGGERIESLSGSAFIRAESKNAELVRKIESFRDRLEAGSVSVTEWQRWMNTASKNGTLEFRRDK
jgi:phage putative head morphogenesis protein, SPP1 gp7 family